MQMPLFAILITGIFTLGVLYWLPSKMIWPWIRAIRTRTDRRIEDVTGQAVQPPAPVADAVRQLEEMQFERVGESKIYLPMGEVVSWYLLGHDGTIMAEVVEYRDTYAVAFTTVFDDESVVETSYFIGERFDTPTYVSDFTRKSLQAALDLHIANVETFADRRHSPVLHMDSMEAIFSHERVYREKHFHRKLLRPLMRSVWLWLFLLISAGISLYMMWRIDFALRTSPDSFQQVAQQLSPLLLVGGIALIGFFVMLGRILFHAGLLRG